MRVLLLTLTLLSTVLATSANALSFGSRLGPTFGAAFLGNYGYIAGEEGLDLYDVTDPHRLRFLRQIRAGEAQQVVVEGDRLYLREASGIRIYDVSVPDSPTEIGAVLLTVEEMAVDGALLVTRIDSAPDLLVVFDVSDPSAAAERSRIPIGAAQAGFRQIRLERGILYAIDDGVLRVFDLADPSDPQELPASPDARPSLSLAAENDTLAFWTRGVGGDGIVELWDVSDPSNPVLQSAVPSFFPPFGLEIRDDRLHVLDQLSYVLYDISDPTNPLPKGPVFAGIGSTTRARSLAVHESFSLIAVSLFLPGPNPSPLSPLLTFTVDTRIEDNPTLVSTTLGADGGIALDAPYAYLAGRAGFSVVDLTDPGAPEVVGQLAGEFFGRSVVVGDGYAFASPRPFDPEVLIVDVRDPRQPRMSGSLVPSNPGSSFTSGHRLHLAGTHLFVLAGGNLTIFDVSDPEQPVELPATFPGGLIDVEVSPARDTLYISGPGSSGVYDIGDIANPVLLSVPPLGELDVTLDESGRLLYVDQGGATGEGGALYDVSDRMAPVFLAEGLSSGEGEFSGDQLRIKFGQYRFYDVSTPRAPIEIGQPWVTTTPAELLTYANHIYDGRSDFAGLSQLRAIELGPEYLPAAEVSMEIRPRTDVNPVNPLSGGSLRLTLYGTESFDVAEVSPESFALGPDRGFPSQVSIRDSDRDGRDDVSLRFPIAETGIAFGDTRVCLRGRLASGRRFRGCDAIYTGSACGLGFEVAPLLVAVAAWRRRRLGRRGSPA